MIYSQDIKRGLSALSPHDFKHFSDPEINLIISSYDLDKDGGLKFSEFSSMIEPKTN